MNILNNEIEQTIETDIIHPTLQKEYDLARRLPDLVFGIIRELVGTGDKNSYWIAYRACRNLVKKEPIKVMDLLQVDEYRYKKKRYRRNDYQRN